MCIKKRRPPTRQRPPEKPSSFKEKMIADQRKWLNDIFDKGIPALQAEFKTIPWADPEATFKAAKKNNDTSPYKCQDEGRVEMDHTNGEYPYYNANHVKLHREEYIIASQPTKETAAAFWAMVVNCEHTIYAFDDCFVPTEKNKTVILAENAIRVTFISDYVGEFDPIDNPCQSTLVRLESKFGPPKEVVIREFDGLEQAQRYYDREDFECVSKKIMIVANDAGYGSLFPVYRYLIWATYVYTADDIIKKTMPGIVKDLRCQRPGLVGTEAQYLFLYNWLIENCMEVTKDLDGKYLKWKEEYKKYEPKLDANRHKKKDSKCLIS